MAFTTFIPKIEWLKATITGTTTISTINVASVSAADIAKLQVGMFINGTGIAAGATITVINATDFDMSIAATASGTNSLNVGNRITLDFPPAKDPFGEKLVISQTSTTSKSGKIQSLENYQERTNKIRFSHISQTLKDEFDTFFTTHFLKGKSFSYFEDLGEPTSELIVEKASRMSSITYSIITRKRGGKDFVYKFDMEFRRTF